MPGPAAYKQAVERIQGVVQADVRLQHVPDAHGLTLRPGMLPEFLAQPTPTAKGTVVLLHGYTAGPWQYKEMAERFFKAGYNVFVPRLPGHGMQTADGTPTGAEMPKSYQRDVYDRFVDSVFSDVSALGGPVYAVGLSGGADLALDMAVRHPQLKRAVAMSLYVGGNAPKGWIFDLCNLLDKLTFGLFGRLLDHIPYSKNVRKPDDPTPHTEASFGAAMALEQLGRSIKSVACPVQFLNTDGDFLSGSDLVGKLFEASGGDARDGWVRFPTSRHVPHAMVSPLEDKAPGAAQEVQDVTFRFIDSGKTTEQH